VLINEDSVPIDMNGHAASKRPLGRETPHDEDHQPEVSDRWLRVHSRLSLPLTILFSLVSTFSKYNQDNDDMRGDDRNEENFSCFSNSRAPGSALEPA
jgi:hypothetical protein